MKHVKFKDNRSVMTKIADSTEKLSKLVPFILVIVLLGIVGTMDMEDEICKNPQSKQCIEYKAEKNK